MAVIVKYDENGSPYFRSARGIGSTVKERENAKKLDALVRGEISNLIKKLKNEKKIEKNTQGNTELYWELGSTTRRIFYNSTLVEPAEKNLFFLNVQIHCPKELLAKDRGPKRIHLEYCFRLAGFSKEKATKMNWGEWVYLFDSPGINREQRFDGWWNIKMSLEPSKLTRIHIRFFAQCVNNLTKKIETNDLTNEQLNKCYEICWLLKERYLQITKNINDKLLKANIKNEMVKHHVQLGEVFEGKLTPEEYSKLFYLEMD